MLTFDKDNFEKEVLKSEELVVVDFWAPWCGPCKMIAPLFDAAAKQVEGVKFGKFNIDDNKELSQKLDIMSVPIIKIYKNGEIVDELLGFQPLNKIISTIKKHA